MDTQTPYLRTPAAQTLVDEATRTFMNRVYGWMFVGLSVTGVAAIFTASTPWLLEIVARSYTFLAIGTMVMVWGVSAALPRLSSSAAGALFLAYAALLGVTLSVIFLIYTAGSIGQVFFISAGAFGALSVFGTVTKKDLSGWGTFLFIGMFGVVAASVVNLFWPMPMLSFVAACAGVVVFGGLTAYDTQKLRAMGASAEASGMKSFAISGALHLYLDFINLFLSLLRLFGSRR